MPQIQIKYQLTLDATVSLVPGHLFIQGKSFTPANTTGGDNLPPDLIYAASDLTIDMLLAGPAGRWTVAVWVMKIDPLTGPTGAWKPLSFNGTGVFTQDVSIENSLIGYYTINWK
jgi:hypothetical protein